MEVCPGFELIAIENTTTRGDDLLEVGKGREVPIGERLIQDGPEVFSGLHAGLARSQPSGSARQLSNGSHRARDLVEQGADLVIPTCTKADSFESLSADKRGIRP